MVLEQRHDSQVLAPIIDKHHPDYEPCAAEYKKSMLIVYMTNMIDMMGFGLLLPLLPYYELPGYNEEHKDFDLGLIIASFSAGQFIGSFVLGAISDRIGRKPVLIVGLFGTAIFYALTGIAPNLLDLIIFRACGGLCAATGGICSSYIADVTRPEERPKHLATLGGFVGLGFILGPVMGSGIGAIFHVQKGFKIASFSAAGVTFLNAVIGLKIFQESPALYRRRARLALAAQGSLNTEELTVKPGLGEYWAAIFQLDLALLCFATFFYGLVFVSLETAITLYLKDMYGLEEKWVGLLFASYGIVLIASQVAIFTNLYKAMSLRFVVMLAPLVSMAAIGVIPISKAMWEIFLAMAFLSLSQGLMTPGLTVIASLLSKEHHGTVMGMRQSFAAACRVGGPVLAGYLYHLEPNFLTQYPHKLPFWVSGGGAALLSFLFVAGIRNVDPTKAGKKADNESTQSSDGPTEKTPLITSASRKR